MEMFLGGLSDLFTSPSSILVLLAGLLGGLVFGAVPGVNLLTLAAIVLPFSVYLSPENAIMFFGVIYVAGVYGGAVTAILFNIPGSPENAPTAFDGYPMTRQGQAGRAIGASVTASAVGGTLSCIAMMIAIEPVAYWAVRAFGPAEVFALVVFGLAMCATVGADSYWKGWLSVLAGMLLATVGTEPTSGLTRFTFGTSFLSAGISFVALILGLFAVSELFVQAHQLARRDRQAPHVHIDFPKVAEFWRMKGLVTSSTGIGFFAGVLPGVGATLAAFLSYAFALKTEKSDPPFGKGNIAGVVASETSNNAATASALIPLLALGLPGGALTAMMLGAFQMHGIDPGPLVFITSANLVWMVFAAMFVANISILLLGYLETKTIVHLLRVPYGVLAPFILLMSVIGAYSLRNLVIDVWVTLVAGTVGYFLRTTGYSIPGLVLGLILGKIGEDNFVKTLQVIDYDPMGILDRPIAATLLLFSLIALIYGISRSMPWSGRARQSPVVAD